MGDIRQLISSKAEPGGELMKRVETLDDLPNEYVCWRCLKVEVSRPGKWCGCLDKPQKSKRPKTGPTAPYDPTQRPPVSEMTEQERLAEIELLTVTQTRSPIAGGAWYRKLVNEIGVTLYDADDLRRADREYHRGGLPANRSHHETEVIPSVRR